MWRECSNDVPSLCKKEWREGSATELNGSPRSSSPCKGEGREGVPSRDHASTHSRASAKTGVVVDASRECFTVRHSPHPHDLAVCPPSTGSATPLMKPAMSEARNATAWATSAGAPKRSKGMTALK